MELAVGYSIEESLVEALIDAGRVAHAVAADHDASPGSNGFTFGADRYHRACELALEPLHDHGFTTHRVGAGLTASRNGTSLSFATARGHDLEDRAVFDPDNSKLRKQAIQINTTAVQDSLDLGLPVPRMFHVVWCGNRSHGLTEVITGCLVGGRHTHMTWTDLHTVYRAPVLKPDTPASANVDVTYADRPEQLPTITARRKAAEDEK